MKRKRIEELTKNIPEKDDEQYAEIIYGEVCLWKEEVEKTINTKFQDSIKNREKSLKGFIVEKAKELKKDKMKDQDYVDLLKKILTMEELPDPWMNVPKSIIQYGCYCWDRWADCNKPITHICALGHGIFGACDKCFSYKNSLKNYISNLKMIDVFPDFIKIINKK